VALPTCQNRPTFSKSCGGRLAWLARLIPTLMLCKFFVFFLVCISRPLGPIHAHALEKPERRLPPLGGWRVRRRRVATAAAPTTASRLLGMPGASVCLDFKLKPSAKTLVKDPAEALAWLHNRSSFINHVPFGSCCA
jgi:hypothetical protein